MSARTSILSTVQDLTLGEAIVVSIGVNVVMFVSSIVLGAAVVRGFRDRRISPAPAPLTTTEITLSAGCVALNSLVMVAGIVLYQRGSIVVIADAPWWRVLVDVAVFFFVMDAAMYVLHRIAHVSWIYPWVHRTHHRFENPRPLTLFVLNPFEVLSFGALWVGLLMFYSSSLLGIVIYLTINLAFGMVGHLGVEPLPRRVTEGWAGWFGTSTFHAGHHADPEHNYGFYTLIWDRVFGTLGHRPS